MVYLSDCGKCAFLSSFSRLGGDEDEAGSDPVQCNRCGSRFWSFQKVHALSKWGATVEVRYVAGREVHLSLQPFTTDVPFKPLIQRVLLEAVLEKWALVPVGGGDSTAYWYKPTGTSLHPWTDDIGWMSTGRERLFGDVPIFEWIREFLHRLFQNKVIVERLQTQFGFIPAEILLPPFEGWLRVDTQTRMILWQVLQDMENWNFAEAVFERSLARFPELRSLKPYEFARVGS